MNCVGGPMKFKFQRVHLLMLLLMTLMCFLFQNCDKQTSFSLVTDPNATNNVAGTPEDNEPETTPEYINKSKSFSVSSSSKVDVLVVIDNSGSMGFEQQSMGNRFSNFIDQLSNLDWQLGIITTDVSSTTKATSDGRLLDFGSNNYLIKSSDDLAAAKTAFANTIQRSEQGNGNEQGLKASIRALERAANPSDNNKVLIRSGAALSIIVVTDANETGSTTSDALFKYVTEKYSGKSFKFHSIIVKNNDEVCLKDKTAYTTANGTQQYNVNEGYGTKYKSLSDKTSGIVGSVCSTDYGSQLQSIGESTAEQIKQITLDCAPVDQDNNGFADLEIRNSADNSLINGYTVHGVQVNFDNFLPAGSYKAEYTCEK